MANPSPDFLSAEWVSALRETALGWMESARAEVFTLEVLLQLGAAGICLAVGLALGKPARKLVDRIFTAPGLRAVRFSAARLGKSLTGAAIAFILLALARIGFEQAGLTSFLLELVMTLVGAWVVIRLATAFIAEPFWARLAANLIWAVAALSILGLLEPFSQFLSGVGMDVGEGGRISLLTVLRAAFILAVLYWVASQVSSVLAKRVQTAPSLTPSARILITKTVQVGLFTVAVLAALSIAGVDLAALAIFSGAVGLGIGFGLQKIFSNLISGVILLLDRSIKPGDVITLEDTYGHVNALSMRFTSVITRDGMEHLIPNEEFITTKVINWSYSDQAVRIKRPIGVAYGADVEKAIELVVEAANSVPRVLREPATKCLLRGFGDSSVDLEVRFWIADPSKGVNNVSSEVLLAVWKSFHENGIEFPFPQRDVHLKTDAPVNVRLETGEGG
ncbi:mechanosensitive ion channel protein MscS [Marinicauda salina]|uniref:Mechanosensitive ion channel protein MscS n=1 Tax=Marinicauda salina TaxID=2135793 RepID=A0A2U2BRX0_9PROT|nr:mechanosensitive ion channel domain-containing protein [Marinicauda salina]PWE16728.1 mechanosensitive ion channel protein MscS [Marinicauda salina]